MPTAEIITIGTELLLGDIQDTNSRYLARKLRDYGIDIYRTTTVGDNIDRIAAVIREASVRAHIIITTGGLGPTVDDPTRDAVARALGVQSVFQPDLWQQIQDRFKRFNRQATENNRRQAFIPAGATAIENKVGTAPAFMAEKEGTIIICLPGVPREMEYLTENNVIPILLERFNLSETLQTLILHVSGMGESQVDELISDLETNGNPTVGLAAHSGVIDIRIAAKARSLQLAAEMLQSMASEIRNRLGAAIYGTDDDTLESIVGNQLKFSNNRLLVIECGLNHALTDRLSDLPASHYAFQTIPQPVSPEEMKTLIQSPPAGRNDDIILAVSMTPGDWQQNMHAIIQIQDKIEEIQRSYGGPAQMGPAWCVNTALDFLRRTLSLHIK